jgi:hypothetical protein
MLPTSEILAIEKLLPLARLCGKGSGREGNYEKKESSAHTSPRRKNRFELAGEHYSLFAERF